MICLMSSDDLTKTMELLLQLNNLDRELGCILQRQLMVKPQHDPKFVRDVELFITKNDISFSTTLVLTLYLRTKKGQY